VIKRTHTPSKCPLSREEENQLVEAAKGGDAVAFDRLWETFKYMGLRVVIARCRFGFTNDERDQVIRISLWDAVRKFDPSRRIRFGTYVFNWFRQGANRLLDNEGCRIIRVPRTQATTTSRTGCKRKYLDRTTDAKRRMREAAIFSLSTEAKSGRPRHEGVSSRDQLEVWEEVDTKLEVEATHARLRLVLSERSVSILERRASGMTLRAIAESEGITHERVKQIQVNAIIKLQRRYPSLLRCTSRRNSSRRAV
jgi:RNA polymerase nonessential primary-like sigma factor